MVKQDWISCILSADDIEAISKKVAEMERKTSAEIVPVIVKRSISIGHVKWQVGTLLLLLMLILLSELNRVYWFQLPWYFTIVGLFCVVGLSRVLSARNVFQRMFTENADEIKQVAQRAEIEFYRSNIQETKDSTGVLIFVSWVERRSVILVDKAVSGFLPDEKLNEITSQMAAHFRSNRFREGLISAIEAVGQILHAKLPPRENNANELSNSLVIRPN